MRAAVRGWCPDLFAPMQSGDGWLVRLKPRLARLTAVQGRLVVEQATRHGNGIIELTGRGNLQLRGLTPASAEAFARFAVHAGLADADPAVERRRNILLSPLAGEDACELARSLERGLASDGALSALPGKFGFAIDGGGPLRLGVAADIVLHAAAGAWQVAMADAAPRHCTAEQATAAALALARAWIGSGVPGRPSRGGGYQDAGQGAGQQAIGPLPALRAFGIGLPFGQTDASMLDRLCGLSLDHGDGILHVTPWRALILSGVRTEAAGPIREAVAGLVVEPDDPRRLVSACIGRPGCASGSVDARADAQALLRLGVRAASLHVSGCAKGCAHPAPAAITLVGAGGRYGLVRAGRAGDTAQAEGLTLAEVARRL